MSEDKDIKNQNENEDKEEKQDESHNGIALGMCFGVALGMSFGQLLYKNMALGMCMGLSLGVCFGAIYDAAQNKKKADGETAEENSADQSGQEPANASEPEAAPEDHQPESGE